MKVLFAGGKGLLGSNIIPLLKSRFDVASLDIDEWDITDPGAGEAAINREKPDVLVNCAAMTDVDGCEDGKELAEKVNSAGAAILAGICSEQGIRLVHISTDYVFDGVKGSPYTEEDTPNPISFYGKTKLWGEERVLAVTPSSLIIRSQWLYGVGGQHFISKVIKIGGEKGGIEVVNDQRGSPTYARDIAEPLAILIEKGESGIYHISNSGSCTWYELALEIFATLGMEVRVAPISSQTLNRKAARPAYSVFDTGKVQRATGVVMRNWQEALQEYLKDVRTKWTR
ncbi:MAG TPA: dTDP-4-dehydrorhamnose reductase [Syntrophorhabdaceae bacterium]|nr:dTDP-4-dehydrorhamnose reductase [Syntrophorhabdaceae bacterium]HQM81675.1 dTDP-4-dehydrorhamnose reductase [Syntrophorhabdaceae bacterium]